MAQRVKSQDAVCVYADGGMNWEDVRYMMAIYRTGTLTAASARLEVNQTTVSRRLKLIEDKLGETLFLRSGAEMIPTDVCKQIVPHGHRMESEFLQLGDQIASFDTGLQGLVRICAMPWIVNELIMPGMPDFLARHPAIKVETISSVRDRNLTKGEADISLRFERLPRGNELCRPVAKFTYSVYAKSGSPASELPWIGYGDYVVQTAPTRWANKNVSDVAITVNDAGACMRAVEQGVGKALLPDLLAGGSSKLEKISNPKKTEITRILRLLVLPDVARYKHVEHVIKWLFVLMKSLNAQVDR